MTQFDFGTRSVARFGEGVRHELSSLLPIDGSAEILVIASESALKREAVASLVNDLARHGSVRCFSKVMPNPRTDHIDECFDANFARNITHVVGIGGGSPLDQAKATAMALSCNSKVSDLLSRGGLLPERTNKLILLPTTSGTGAELSYGAILTDSSSGEKLGLRGAAQAADIALVDPELTYTVPRYTSMETGFDVLTHALETYISSAATPYTQDLSRAALQRVFRWLPVLYGNLGDIEARREMAYASMLMGHCLALSTTCLPHRLQYPIGAATDTAHAAGLAAIYPTWLAQLVPQATEKLANCAVWIGVSSASDSTEQQARAFIDAVINLMDRIEFRPSLRDLGVTTEMIARFPDEVTGKLHTDPSYTDRSDLAAMYRTAFG